MDLIYNKTSHFCQFYKGLQNGFVSNAIWQEVAFLSENLKKAHHHLLRIRVFLLHPQLLSSIPLLLSIYIDSRLSLQNTSSDNIYISWQGKLCRNPCCLFAEDQEKTYVNIYISPTIEYRVIILIFPSLPHHVLCICFWER